MTLRAGRVLATVGGVIGVGVYFVVEAVIRSCNLGRRRSLEQDELALLARLPGSAPQPSVAVIIQVSSPHSTIGGCKHTWHTNDICTTAISSSHRTSIDPTQHYQKGATSIGLEILQSQ